MLEIRGRSDLWYPYLIINLQIYYCRPLQSIWSIDTIQHHTQQTPSSLDYPSRTAELICLPFHQLLIIVVYDISVLASKVANLTSSQQMFTIVLAKQNNKMGNGLAVLTCYWYQSKQMPSIHLHHLVPVHFHQGLEPV